MHLFFFTSKMKTQKNFDFLFLFLKSFIFNKIACGTDDFPLSRNSKAARLSQSKGETQLDSNTEQLSKLFALITEILSTLSQSAVFGITIKKKIYILRHNRNFTVKSLTAAKQNLVYLLQNLNLKNTASMSFQNTVQNVFFAHILLKAEI